MRNEAMTRERYIQAVRSAALAVAVLSTEERDHLAGLKMVYGTGYGTGARGITYHEAWTKPVNGCSHVHAAPAPGEVPAAAKGDALIEICAFAEESLVQLAGTTVHEMGHALAGVGKGHGKEWAGCCKRLGLRGMRAAGTQYVSAMFVPALREKLAAIPVPTDGRVIGWNERGAGAGLAGLFTRVRPCSAGIGSRGGKSRGVGSGSRLRKYVCGCGQIIRASTDTLEATHGPCGTAFQKE